jgi:hypothetical protein
VAAAVVAVVHENDLHYAVLKKKQAVPRQEEKAHWLLLPAWILQSHRSLPSAPLPSFQLLLLLSSSPFLLL